VIVRFADIGIIVTHHWLNLGFIINKNT
jgi:hypothetical protein